MKLWHVLLEYDPNGVPLNKAAGELFTNVYAYYYLKAQIPVFRKVKGCCSIVVINEHLFCSVARVFIVFVHGGSWKYV